MTWPRGWLGEWQHRALRPLRVATRARTSGLLRLGPRGVRGRRLLRRRRLVCEPLLGEAGAQQQQLRVAHLRKNQKESEGIRRNQMASEGIRRSQMASEGIRWQQQQQQLRVARL